MNAKNIVVTIIGIIILGGVFMFLMPKSSQAPTPNYQPTPAVLDSTPTPKTNIFELVIKANKLASGSGILQVSQGDEVTIKITSDADEEFHLHGYDKSIDLEPGVEAVLLFTANLSGRFPFELEHSKTEIGALEVTPR